MKKITIILAAIMISQFSFSQSESNVLLTIDTNQISKNEFLRIYNKNSNIESSDQKSVDEYIELFINYKLKVLEARRLGYDTVSSYVKELSGYQDQLTKQYLENDQLYEKYAEMAYQRLTKEICVNHILIKLDRDALPQDSLVAYNRALEVRKRVLSGEPFEVVARAASNDRSVTLNSGNLGCFTVFQMMYPFETAAYNLSVGQISMPVRTVYGYHIIKLTDLRPNRGELNVAHIMAWTPRNPTEKDMETAKEKIEKAYTELQNGEPWNSVVNKYSDHKATLSKGGNIGWVKAGIVPDDFLDICFATDSGKYSKPFLSVNGYHIIKVLEHKAIPTFDTIKVDLTKKLKNNEVVQDLVKENLVTQIKNEYGFKLYLDNINALYALIDSSSLKTGKWDAHMAENQTNPVFSLGDNQFSQYDLAKFVSEKIFQNRGSKLERIKDKWTNEYIANELIEYEKKQLPSKNTDLKNLLNEYHDGILLFNLTEDMVWKKAVEDSLGLKDFYNQMPDKYYWKNRVQIAKYTYSDSTLTNALLKLAKKRIKNGYSAEQMSKILCPNDTVPCLSIAELKFEKGDNAIGDSIKWNPGAYISSKVKRKFNLFYVERTLPGQMKKFEEARGLYTADYQNRLEQQWIKELRGRYSIHINQDVLESIKKTESKNK